MYTITKKIFKVLDFFYPLFESFLNRPTFYYLACGGANSLLDLILFSTGYEYIFKGNLIQIGILKISSHITALFFSLFITIPTGFFLSKHIVFQSVANNKIQFLKYSIIVIFSLIINYVLMDFFVETIHITPFISKICTTSTIVIFSYLGQKKFAFKKT